MLLYKNVWFNKKVLIDDNDIGVNISYICFNKFSKIDLIKNSRM